MTSISYIVEKIIKENPSLEISLSKNIISFSKLARYMQESTETELGYKVKESAIIMALKRIQERSKKIFSREKSYNALEIGTTSSIGAITIGKSKKFSNIVKKLYEISNLKTGAILNITHSDNQTTIVFSERIARDVEQIIKYENLIARVKDLAQISITFGEEMVKTPGFLVYVLKELSWNEINVVEIVSTYTELIVILNKTDITQTYKILEGLLL